MAVRGNLKKKLHYRKRIITEDGYGATLTKYLESHQIYGSYQPLAGKMDFEEWGEKASYIYRCFIPNAYQVSEFDGFNLFNDPLVDDPDYIIMRIKPWKSVNEVFIIATEEV